MLETIALQNLFDMHPLLWFFTQLIGVDFKSFIKTATGPVGLIVVFVYSFLIAVALPLPNAVVLAVPLNLGLPEEGRLAVVILVSGLGKATGSVVVFYFANRAQRLFVIQEQSVGEARLQRSGSVRRQLWRVRLTMSRWAERRVVELIRQYGYVGFAISLAFPGIPDTLSIYAFAVLERNYLKFGLAAFVGSVGRLLMYVFGFEVITELL